MDGIAKAKDKGVRFGRKRDLTQDRVEESERCESRERRYRPSLSESALARRGSTEP
jgi:hypothetical protein